MYDCIFNSALQISITDAFLAFNLENHSGEDQPSFPDFLSRLVYQLIHNTFDAISFQSPANSRRTAAAPAVSHEVKSHEQHQLLNLALLSPFKGFLFAHFITACTISFYSNHRKHQSSKTMQRQKLQKENRIVLRRLFYN